MDERDEPIGKAPRTFPGPVFWRWLEALVTAVGLGSPRRIFKLRQARAQWEERREQKANLERGISYTHKTCPACSRLVKRGSGRCEYCGASVRWAQGPGLARTLGLSIPHGSVAMTIVALNILMFAITVLISARNTGMSPVAAIFHPDGDTLLRLGAMYGKWIITDGEFWRLWTYQFLHGGALHIFFNLYALLSLGPATEDVYGPAKTAALYWAAGVGAGLTSFLWRMALLNVGVGARGFPLMVGASGAIFGLIGLLIGHTYKRGGTQGANLRAFLVRWAIYGLIMGFIMPAVDNAAHIGGLATGFVLGLLVDDGARRDNESVTFWRVAAIAAVGLTAYGYVAAVFSRSI